MRINEGDLLISKNGKNICLATQCNTFSIKGDEDSIVIRTSIKIEYIYCYCFERGDEFLINWRSVKHLGIDSLLSHRKKNIIAYIVEAQLHGMKVNIPKFLET